MQPVVGRGPVSSLEPTSCCSYTILHCMQLPPYLLCLRSLVYRLSGDRCLAPPLRAPAPVTGAVSDPLEKAKSLLISRHQAWPHVLMVFSRKVVPSVPFTAASASPLDAYSTRAYPCVLVRWSRPGDRNLNPADPFDYQT
jgi:hypothetical protein